MSQSFATKSILKPILSEIIGSKVFDAAYEACVGIRIVQEAEQKQHDLVIIDLHDDSDLVAFGTFEMGCGTEIFNKIKDTVIETYQGNFTYTAKANEEGKVLLVDTCKSVKTLLDEADDIILSSNEGHNFEGYQQISFYSPTNRGAGETFYVKLD